MASRSFSEALGNLSSEKIKDRTQGLEDVRIFLSIPRNIEWINHEKKNWLKLLQAIFQIVVDEQRNYVKKPAGGTSPALKRLRDGAQVVRLIIERCTADIPRKAFKAVFNHIVSIIVLKAELFEPIALEYLKALRAIFTYRPHLDHLEAKQWTHAVALCFSAALGDSIQSYTIAEDSVGSDDESEMTETAGSLHGTSRKRKATQAPRATQSDQNGIHAGSSSAPRSAGQDVIELMGCIETMFRASNAPFASYGQALLAKFIRFFRLFPFETSAHLPALIALNRLICEMYFNSRRVLERAAPAIWPFLLQLWPTKNSLVKEQLVVALESLLPYLVHCTNPSQGQQVAFLQQLYTAIRDEPDNRWGVDELGLDSLDLGRPGRPPSSFRENLSQKPFQGCLIRAGHLFSAAQALTWAVLELGASCLSYLQCSSQALRPDVSLTPNSKGKKRKLDTPLDSLLDELRHEDRRAATAALQMLVFFLQAHYTSLRFETLKDVLECLNIVLTREDAEVRSWALIAISTLCVQAKERGEVRSRAELEELERFWKHGWDVAARRSTTIDTGRAACLLLTVYVDESAIHSSDVVNSLQGIVRDLEVQGPAFPFDTACDFLSRLVTLCAKNAALFSLNVKDKILSRLTSHWALLPPLSPNHRLFSNSRPHWEPFNAAGFLRLLLQVSDIDETTTGHEDPLLPDCHIVHFKSRQAEETTVHAWYFRAQLPSYSRPSSPKVLSFGEAADKPHTLANAGAIKSTTVLRIALYFRRSLEGILEEIIDAEDAYWQSLAAVRLRRIFDIGVTALLLDAAADLRLVIRNDRITSIALQVLERLLPKIFLSKWIPSERSYLLMGLVPLVLAYPTHPATLEPLVEAGPMSGTRQTGPHRDSLLLQSQQVPAVPELLQRLWSDEDFRRGLANVRHAFEAFFTLDTSDAPTTSKDRDEEFGVIKTTSSTKMTGRATFSADNALATARAFELCIRFLMTLTFFEDGAKQPVRLRHICKEILNGTGTHIVIMGRHVMRGVESGFLVLSNSEMDAILERIGEDLLPSYEYARADELHLFVLDFLKVTASIWGKDEPMALSYVNNARRLSAWFTGQVRNGNIASVEVRKAFAVLLDAFSSDLLSQDAWGDEDEDAACHQGSVIPPVLLITEMLKDPDFRVRFAVAPILGRACAHVQQGQYDMWNSIASSSTFDLAGNGSEGIATLLLSYGNVMVASDHLRPNAYKPIILYAALDSSKNASTYIQSLLGGVAARLGLDNLADMYAFLAPYTIAGQVMDNTEQMVIPDPKAFGFSSRREMYESAFVDVGATILAGPRPSFFDKVCSFIGVTRALGISRCLHSLVAYKLAIPRSAGATMEDQKAQEASVYSHAEEVGLALGQSPDSVLRNVKDLVVFKIFSFIWESTYNIRGINDAFSAEWPGALETMTAMLEGINDAFRPNALSPPNVPLKAVLQALRCKHASLSGALESESVVYSILQHLFTAIDRPPFVSQQMRLLYNTTICISCASPTIKRHPSLLFLLLKCSARLLRQPDLLPVAANIFRWALHRSYSYFQITIDSRIEAGNILAGAAEAITSVAEHPGARQSALQMLNDLEVLLVNADEGKEQLAKESVLTAVALWPRSTKLHDQLEAEQVSALVPNSRVRVRKLRIACHLCDSLSRQSSPISADRLAQTLWYILNRVSGLGESADLAGATALADLLLYSAGKVCGPSLADVAGSGSVQDRALKDIQQAIIGQIASLLEDDSLEVIQEAFEALRGVLSSEGLDVDIVGDIKLIASLGPGIRFARPAASRALLELIRGDAWLHKGANRTAWQRDLACLLARDLGSGNSFFLQVLPLLQRAPLFAGGAMSHLVHAILLADRLSGENENSQLLSSYFERLLQCGSACMEDVVALAVQLRQFRPPESDTNSLGPLARNSWLAIPWLNLALAAATCKQYSTALLFLELAREHGEVSDYTLSQTVADGHNQQKIQNLLYDIYSNIQEPDGFYGIKDSDSTAGLIRRIHHEGRWMDALAWHGANYEILNESGPEAVSASAGIVQALAASDLSKLAMTLLRSMHGDEAASSLPAGLPYRLAGKTSQWDLPATFTKGLASSQANFFKALRTTQNDLQGLDVRKTVATALCEEIYKLVGWNGRSALQPDQHTVSAILGIREIHRWRAGNNVTETEAPIRASMTNLEHIPSTINGDAFQARLACFQAFQRQQSRNIIGDDVTPATAAASLAQRDSLVFLGKQARFARRPQAALNAILMAMKLDPEDTPSYTLRFELACVLWSQGEHVAAVEALKTLYAEKKLGRLTISQTEEATLLSYLGEWTSDARLQVPASVREQYFEPAAAILSKKHAKASDEASEVANRYAKFSDQQYQRMTKQVGEMERLEAYSKRKQTESKSYDSTKSTQESTARRDAEVQSQQDLRIVRDFRRSKKAFLETSVLMYAHTLSASDKNDAAIFRVIALWLENADDEGLNAILQQPLRQIPSYKYVPLIQQISSRTTSGAAIKSQVDFQSNLSELLGRLCKEHPFHTLFQIYFLRQNVPPKNSVATRRISAGLLENTSQIRRAEAINDIVLKLRKVDGLKIICQYVETAMAAYIEWANIHPDVIKAMKKKLIPADLAIGKLANLPIPVTTIALPIDKTCTYDPSKMPCIKGFEPKFKTAGGLHLPKITQCNSTDGQPYLQLYKGGDDVRQDAVVQQIFAVANDVLARDEGTRSRELALRTYKVVPLTSEAGLLEFVQHSQALGSWLVPAHDRYNIGDVPIKEVREQLSKLRDRDQQTRIDSYKAVIPRIRPAMRHLFTETHYLPSRWFEMRLIYSRSVAVMSMVGHVLGLGDRHVSNIMIDVAKGELIPIDFGIMFEAGKTLPTPERVPFRLTRDIVDGFGMSGVDGVFRKCSEETMRVLRTQSSVLMTILEVFRFDPLQKWTASAQKVKRAQGSEAIERSRDDGVSTDIGYLTDADRAIASVAGKLNSDLSIQYQVNDLILQATDVDNLGSIFFGWQPYL